MLLDLRISGKLPPIIAERFEIIAHENRRLFNQLVDKLSSRYEDDIHWWVSGPPSRNTIANPFYRYFCIILLIQELISEKREVEHVIVDSPALEGILLGLFQNAGCNISVEQQLAPGSDDGCWWIRALYLTLRYIRIFAYTIWGSKRSRKLARPIPAHPLIIIDTFVLTGFINKDRYYGGLWDRLTDAEKEIVYFVPTLFEIPPKKFRSVFHQLKTSVRNFLLKEDYLKITDYLHALYHIWRIITLGVPSVKVRGIDFSPLVREQLRSLREVDSSITAILNYRFARRLRLAGMELRTVINWFENQIVDKGWNAGFRRYYPDIDQKGYLGMMITPHYLAMFPTEQEERSQVIPPQIAVVGPGQVRMLKEFYPGIKVVTSPALRFQQVWEDRENSPDANYFTILIPLPIDLTETNVVLNLVDEARQYLHSDRIRFYVKPHPTITIHRIKENFGREWPKSFVFVDGTYKECIEKSNLFIGNSSSTCMETLAKGVPVIVAGNPYGLTHNPIPSEITEDIWRLCQTPEDIAEGIRFYSERDDSYIKRHEEIGLRIRQEYFEPVTREGIRKFLGLDSAA